MRELWFERFPVWADEEEGVYLHEVTRLMAEETFKDVAWQKFSKGHGSTPIGEPQVGSGKSWSERMAELGRLERAEQEAATPQSPREIHSFPCGCQYWEEGHNAGEVAFCLEHSAPHGEDPTELPEDTVPKRHPNSARFHELLKLAGDLHDKKQMDYGKGNDPFANVRASSEWGLKPWVGAMLRLGDKVKRLQALATKGSLANEPAKDSFMDIAVYALIAHVLFEQEEEKA